MAWTWRLESADGAEARAEVPVQPDDFPTRSDAETWIGEYWRELREQGVARVVLREDGRAVAEPMSLDDGDA